MRIVNGIKAPCPIQKTGSLRDTHCMLETIPLASPSPHADSDQQSPQAGAQLSSLPFHCTVVRQPRKTLALHVRHQKVEVRVPLRVGRREVEVFVAEHHDWIQKRLTVEAKRDAERLRLENGAVILYKARELTLRFREAHSSDVYEEDSELVIQGRGLRGSTEIVKSKAKKILERHLKAQAEIVLIPRAHELAEKMGLGQRLTQVGLRKTKSKWGHCTSTGVLQLNWLIMLAPNAVVDYLIAHEVCHLQHMNHSKQFWALVNSVCPDSQRYVAWLKANEHRLFF